MGCLSNLLEKLAFESSSVKWVEQLGFRLLCKWKLRQIARQLESLNKIESLSLGPIWISVKSDGHGRESAPSAGFR